jgi:cytochrome bd-type quinol oxidase subunit 2
MDLDPLLLSRIQFAFVIAFHIIFPAFTIGLAAWLATIEGMRMATADPVYRRVFDFWLKVFALSFGMGVVTGIVMAFQFGTNWSVLSERTGSIQGPLLGYETFTGFLLEATFFGVMLLGRERVPPWFYFLSCCMVSFGTMLSSFWILCNNSWMQVPLGHVVVDGKFVPDDWWAITTGPIVRVRWPHMLFACFLTTGMSVVATGAWFLLRRTYSEEGRVMLRRCVTGRGGASPGSPAPCWSCSALPPPRLSLSGAGMTGNLFLGRPWGLIFPAIGLLALCGVFIAARRRRDAWPFALTAVFFVAALLSLAVMFWPYMIPYTITVGSAAAPEKTLSFLFWGAGVFILPVIAVYTAVVYWVFRGKLRTGYR